MGLRYRSSIRLARGLRINLWKSGASLSVGQPAATVNLGNRGVRSTVGLPGSGISYSEMKPWHRRAVRRAGEFAANPTSVRRGAPIIGWLILIVAVGVVVALLGR